MHIRVGVQMMRAQSKKKEGVSERVRYEPNLRCFTSLVHSLEVFRSAFSQSSVELVVFDFGHSQMQSDLIQNILRSRTFLYQVVSPAWRQPEWILHEIISKALAKSADAYYLTHSEFLHAPQALTEMVDFHSSMKSQIADDFFIAPQELRGEPGEKRAIRTSYRHWIPTTQLSGGYYGSRSLHVNIANGRPAQGFFPSPGLAVAFDQAPAHASLPWKDWWNETRNVLG